MGVTLYEIFFGGVGGIFVLMTFFEISRIKINPWSAIIKAIGKIINGDVLNSLNEVKSTQDETRKMLDDHIRQDADRAADQHRARILQFNTELLRGMEHTREDFIDILAEIDAYRDHCKKHPDYPNSRATHAISNIDRVYDDRLKKQDFL